MFGRGTSFTTERRMADGNLLMLLSIVDEYTRECPALEVARTLNRRRVIELLERLFVDRGIPKHVRSDNGPKYVAKAVRIWPSDR